MSSYWKQSLWIGGIYWIISQFFSMAGSLQSSLIDAGLSVLLLLFLIPMNWLQPIKGIDRAIRKAPVISTLLVSVGWVPYAIAVIFIVNALAAVWIVMAGPQYEYHLITLVNTIIIVTNLRYLITILTILTAVFMILVRHKSIAGCLDKHYKLTADDGCDAVAVEPAVAASAKSLYACKEAAKERKAEDKPVAKKMPAVKSAGRKKTTAPEKKTVKAKPAKAAVKKTASKPAAAAGEVKPKAKAGEEAVTAETKTTATKAPRGLRVKTKPAGKTKKTPQKKPETK